MKKKIFFIAISVLIMIFGISYMAINHYLASQKSFEKAGYILSSKDNSSSNKSTAYYFSDNTKYKNRFDDTVTFNDVNGDKVNVDESSFIHYNDESIGVLKKAVIFNLEQIDSEIPIYYNIFENTILKYNSNRTYSVDNLGKRLIFQNFIVKVSDNKFLIIGDKMQVDLDKTSTVTMNSNFIELTFVDDKVVTIEDKDSKYQTISKDAIIHLNDEVTLNLDNRYLYKEKEAKLSIDQMVIDSSDNIEIQPIEEGNGEEEEGVDGSEGGNGGSGSDIDGVAGDGTAIDGTVDDGTTGGDSYVETEVQEAALALPNAEITDSSITPFTFSADVHITDKDNLMYGPIYASIIENSTGRFLYYEEFPEGSFDLAISAENLSAETTYNLQVTLSYRKNNVEYTMDAIQYVFITSSIGVSLEKDYYTTDSLNFNLVFDSYSSIKECTVDLYYTDGKHAKSGGTHENVNGSTDQISFDGLTPDTKYNAVIHGIVYDESQPDKDLTIEVSARTLKEPPVIVGQPTFQVDKRMGTFTLILSNVKDPNNGVVTYRYEIYDADSPDKPVLSIEKENLASLDLDVKNANEDSPIVRNKRYFYRVVIEFYDNEKYIEYTTPDSDIMTLGGVTGPKMRWNEIEVTFERIVGEIVIEDENQTIDRDKPVIVSYRNSIGNVDSFQAMLKDEAGYSINRIHFDKNNLRSQETYTIEVTASVSLQEQNGNPAYESYSLVGSIIVNTPKPDPLNVEFEIPPENTGASFAVNAQLKNGVEYDNILEAQTLTGITFNLYVGDTISERNKLRTITMVDSNTKAYESDLKDAYYDKPFEITPGFFGLNNSDITESLYTVEVTKAYDYTDFRNPIEIVPVNHITVAAMPSAPDNPTDGFGAVDYHLIKNKDVKNDSGHKNYPGFEYDENLKPETVVGFSVAPKFDNSARYARTITYHVYDADTCVAQGDKQVCKEVYTETYEVPESGVIAETNFHVGYGTDFSQEDNEVTRGHRYYVSYEAELDMNGDGQADYHYPQNDVELRCDDFDIPKQSVILNMYPSTSSTARMTVKYEYSDIDKATEDNKLYFGLGSLTGTGYVLMSSYDLKSGSNDGQMWTVSLSDLREGVVRLYTKEHLLKNTPTSEHDYIKQYFRNEYAPNQPTYHLNTGSTNVLIVIFDDYETNTEFYKRVTSVNVKFTAEVNGKEKTIEKKNLYLSGKNLIIDLSDIAEFLNKTVSVEVSANYDSELFGFDMTADNFALQTIINESGGGNYFTVSSLGEVNASNEKAMGSDFTITKQSSDGKTFFNALNNVTNKPAVLPYEYDEGGMVYNYNHYLMKVIKNKTINPRTATDRDFEFSTLVPGISVLDAEKHSRIIPLITSVDVGATISGVGDGTASEIKDDMINIQVYKEPYADQDRSLIKEVKVTISQLSAGITIEDLEPDTHYSLEFLADVSSGDEYITKHLFDIDENQEVRIYYFTTQAGVEFSNVSHRYVAKEYNSKSIIFTYDMDKTTGFQKIRYKLSKIVCDEDGECTDEPLDIEIEDETTLTETMRLSIDVNPGENKFEFDNTTKYKLEIIPVALVNVEGGQKEILLSKTLDGKEDDEAYYEFTLNYLASPMASIQSNLQSFLGDETGSIMFCVTLFDRDRVIVGDEYTIKILSEDGNDITPAEYKGQKFQTTSINNKFTIANLKFNNSYTFEITCYVDSKNTGDSSKEEKYTKKVTLFSSDRIYIGDVSAVQDSTYPNRVALRFIDSFQLDYIDNITYSIMDSEGITLDGTSLFKPKKDVVADGTVYTFSIPQTLPAPGSYYIQANFMKGNQLVDQINISYIYISN